MEIKEIENRIVENIRKRKTLSISDDELKKCEDLTGLGFDSIDLMYNVISLEAEFSCEFCEEDLEFENVNSIVKLVSLIHTYKNA